MQSQVNGSYLKKLRKEKKLFLSQVAKYVGCSTSHIANIERGLRKNPNYQIVQKMAELYGVDPSSVYTGEQKERLKKTVDLIKELYSADILLLDNEELPLNNEFVLKRIETGIRMGVAWALVLIQEDKKSDS